MVGRYCREASLWAQLSRLTYLSQCDAHKRNFSAVFKVKMNTIFFLPHCSFLSLVWFAICYFNWGRYVLYVNFIYILLTVANFFRGDQNSVFLDFGILKAFEAPESIFKIFNIVLVWCVHVGAGSTAPVWRSKDDFESVLSSTFT